MKNSRLIFVFLILFGCIIFACKKKMPLETQSGENTFGCYVNEKLIVPKRNGLNPPVLRAYYSQQNGKPSFNLYASMKEKETLHSIAIKTDSFFLAVGTYEISTLNTSRVTGEYRFSEPTTMGTIYNSTSLNKGELVIKHYDSGKRIVSGTFWFDAINNNGQKVEVREGRFDVKLY